jgi:nicotinamide-nucleotide amidase
LIAVIALEEAVGRLLAERGLAVAESCTGGLIAHRLTNAPGSSRYFLGGVVAYANEVKERVLGVRPGTLREDGAVSREAALEMARGVRRLLGADIAISATGIAGPTGGMPEKPVGLVYVALAAEDFEQS